MPKKMDLTGQTFERLKVVERISNYKDNHTYYRCICKCGNEKIIYSYDLTIGKTKSCGCLHKEIVTENNMKHNSSNTLLYDVYVDMIRRCYYPKHRQYKNYGAIGIGVDEIIWRDGNGFLDYKEWAYATGYKEEILPNGKNKWTIDRIDNSKGYSKENCRWVTNKIQANNKRNNRLFEYNGETHTMAEWAELLKISYWTLRSRLDNPKWTIEKALTTPIKVYKENPNGSN